MWLGGAYARIGRQGETGDRTAIDQHGKAALESVVGKYAAVDEGVTVEDDDVADGLVLGDHDPSRDDDLGVVPLPRLGSRRSRAGGHDRHDA